MAHNQTYMHTVPLLEAATNALNRRPMHTRAQINTQHTHTYTYQHMHDRASVPPLIARMHTHIQTHARSKTSAKQQQLLITRTQIHRHERPYTYQRACRRMHSRAPSPTPRSIVSPRPSVDALQSDGQVQTVICDMKNKRAQCRSSQRSVYV